MADTIQMKDKVNSTLEHLKDGKEVGEKDLEMMKEVLSDKEALKLLEKKLEEKESKILSSLSEDQMKKVYQNLSQQERQNFEKLFNKISVDKDQKAKKVEIQRAIKDKKVELAKLEGWIRSGSTYKVENFRSKDESKEEVKLSSSEHVSSAISDQEMENLNKILWGKFLVEEKLNKVEKKLKSDFKKAIIMLKENSNVSLMEVIRAFNKGEMSKVELEKSFARKDKKEWSEKEVDKLQQAYLAYLESKKDNADTARWNRVMNALESGIINGEKSLDVIYQENVSKPISKKERKQGLEDEQWKYRLELAKDGKASEWKNNYMQQNREEIDDMKRNWSYEGYSGEQINQMTKDYLNDRFDSYTKKEWKKHLKEEQKNWIQKSDLGNFRVLVDFIEKQNHSPEGQKIPPEKQISMLLTDTNFDGVRNHLDGRGTKRGDQIDLAIRMAQAEGLSMDAIARNIVIHLHTKKGENFGGAVPGTADTFAAWLRSDIKHARLVQSALMDTPENAVDIMRYGADALKKTLEAQKLTPEELKQIEDKINTDPATRELSQQARDTLMANLSSYLLSKMREPGVNANVNGLGVGVNMPLNQILKGLSLNLGTGSSLDGQPFVGVSLAWNTEVAKWDTGNVSAGIFAGTTLGIIPIYGFRAGVKQDLNVKKVLGNIDPTSLKSLSVGGNVTMLGAIPSWGVSAGIDKDKIGGIEKQYDHIKKEITPIIEKLLTKDKDGNYPDITATLKTLFNTSSDAEIKKAAENLTSVLERTKAENLDPKEAAQLIGQRYAESWKNNAVQGLPKGWRFTGASLGVQFLAGFFPVATLSATLTKYKNLSHSDSPESRARLQQSIEMGRGDASRESVKKQDFDNIRNQLAVMNVLNSSDKLEINQNWDLVLSQSLLNKTWFKVKINENLKGYLKSENGNLIIPAGVSYRFLTSARANGSISELDIGYEKWSQNLQSLKVETLQDYLGSKDYALEQNIKSLEAALKSFNLVDVEIKDGKMFQKGAEIWTLKKDSGVAIDKDWKIKITAEKGRITKELQSDLTIDEELIKEVDSVVTPEVIKKLVSLSKQKSQFENFKWFLKNAKAMKAEYLMAAEELGKMLSWKEYNGLKTKLGVVEKDGKKVLANPKVAIQIMDRLKSVFATVSESQKSSRNAVENLARQRNSEYMRHHQRKSVLEDFSAGKLKIDYVGLAGQLSPKPQSNPMENLIGFTAFYRRNAKDARGMSMTAYGQTNVLDKTFPVEKEQEDQAKQWLLANLEKQPMQLKAIAKSIGNFEEESDALTNDGYLSEKSIKELLSWKSIDLWKKNITLNTQIVKYFLAECANESIGIQIDGITIEDSQQVEQQPTKMTFNASEATAQANIKKSDFSIGIAFGGRRKEEKNQNSGYGGYTEQEGGTGKGKGPSGKPLEPNEWSTQQNSEIQPGAWTGGDGRANGEWER